MRNLYTLLLAVLFAAPTLAQPANDSCQYAMWVPFACDTTLLNQTTIAATFDNVGFCGTSNTAPGVWYNIPGHDGVITLSTCNQANYDTKISVFTGTCGSLICVAGQDDAAGCSGFTTELSFMPNPIQDYYVFVHGFGSATGNFDLTISRSFNVQPQNLEICYGDSVLIDGTYQSTPGNYPETFISSIGCDSTVMFNLTVLPELTGLVEDTLCYNDTLNINGTTYDVNNPSGTEVLTSLQGCDSTVTVELMFYPEQSSIYDTTICSYDTVFVNGTAYHFGNPSGTEYIANIGPNGCDSLVYVNVSFTAIDTSIVFAPPMLTSNQAGANYQWYECDSMTAIPGANDPDFMATVTGNYGVEIELDGCIAQSECYLIDFTGITENDWLNVAVYPNPATNGQVTIESDAVIHEVAVVDLLGRTCDYSFDGTNLDISTLTPGRYLIEIHTERGKLSELLIVK